MTATLRQLGDEHREVLQRLAQAEAAIAAAATDFGEFARFLDTDVMRHFTLEEEALFPLLERHLGVEHGPLAVMNAEHDAFRELLGALHDGVRAADGEAQRNAAREIVRLLRGHIDKEDHVLFPMAGRLLSDAELQEVEARAAALT